MGLEKRAEEKGGGMLLRRLSLLAGRALGLEARGPGWSQTMGLAYRRLKGASPGNGSLAGSTLLPGGKNEAAGKKKRCGGG